MVDVHYIKSETNNKLKLIKNIIQFKKYRSANKLFVAEGLKVVEQISQSVKMRELFCSDIFYQQIKNNIYFNCTIKKCDCRINVLSARCFDKISSLTHPDGILGLFPLVQHSFKQICNYNITRVILCEDIQDPSNLGSIIRNCYCLGASALLLTEKSVDMYNQKVIRSSAGYIGRLPIAYITYDDIKTLKKRRYLLYASEFKDKRNSINIKTLSRVLKRVIFAFGNEGKGLSQELKKISDKFFYIPMREYSESLNISSAIAITLFCQFDDA